MYDSRAMKAVGVRGALKVVDAMESHSRAWSGEAEVKMVVVVVGLGMVAVDYRVCVGVGE